MFQDMFGRVVAKTENRTGNVSKFYFPKIRNVFFYYFLYLNKKIPIIRSYIADKISMKMLQFLMHILIEIMITAFRQAFFRSLRSRSGRSQSGGLPQSPLRTCQTGQTRCQNLGRLLQ